MLTQLCSTLCDPIDCSPSGASTHGIFWVRMLEWVAISFSRGSSLPRDWTHIYYVTCIGKCILYLCATWEAHELLRPIGWSRNDVVRLLRLSLKRPCSLCFHHFATFMNLSWVGKIPWRRKWQPMPVFLLETPMGRGAWWAGVRGVARVRHDLATEPPPPPSCEEAQPD